eukprot:10755429-Ditylum_brightwellii.AAC.1
MQKDVKEEDRQDGVPSADLSRSGKQNPSVLTSQNVQNGVGGYHACLSRMQVGFASPFWKNSFPKHLPNGG